MKRVSLCLFGLVASVLCACGDSGGSSDSGSSSDSGGSGSSSDSDSNAVFDNKDSLNSAMESPTGIVSETTAKLVADRMAEASSSMAGKGSAAPSGIREKAQEQNGSDTIDCENGGTIDIESSETQETLTYNDCQMAGCTLNGSEVAFPDPDQICVSVKVNEVCGDESTDIASSSCTSMDGTVVYLVDVEGDTFQVSGTYSDGDGELTITGANGTFTCTYVDGGGTCVDSEDAEFSF